MITKIVLFFEFLEPFKSDIRYIRANYDHSIYMLFVILQVVYVFCVLNAANYAYLIANHSIKNK